MPNHDGSLSDADRLRLVHALNLMIPVEESVPGPGTLGLLGAVEARAVRDKLTLSALLRIVEAMSLDLTAHAVGGYSAMTERERIDSLLNIERTLPDEFTIVLNIVRDVYYEDSRTPPRPQNFESENEIFGKVSWKPDLNESQRARGHVHGRAVLRSPGSKRGQS
ncbi:MAG: hypothetical protein O3B95_09855 [Chloroflexi bacterium]|nr:hypothetical protein [Chloroflexota bacterium]